MWVYLDKKQIELMWRVYHTDVALVACKNVIQNKLLSLGVMFTMGDQVNGGFTPMPPPPGL